MYNIYKIHNVSIIIEALIIIEHLQPLKPPPEMDT
jgi:hypothetical protein